MDPPITVTRQDAVLPAAWEPKCHHVGAPPTAFQNPWPSAASKKLSLLNIASIRFRSHPEKTHTPLPASLDGERSEELVKIQKPDWGVAHPEKIRATWIGHASWIIEMPVAEGASRGIRIALDPVFADRMSPVSFAGPKRFSPTPCSIEDVPDIDIIIISHNHYDHCDLEALAHMYAKRKGRIQIVAGLNSHHIFTNNVGSSSRDTIDLDWWDRIKIDVAEAKSSVTITCCPAQHGSRRSVNDGNHSLWCSFAIASTEAGGKKLYFAGDTGYKTVEAESPCPAFKQVGELLGPFDLGLVPIGCFKPAGIMGAVHASPYQSLEIHKDVKSKLSIGMHYMTIRGGLSGAFEAVQDPALTWKAAAEKQDLWCGGGIAGNGSPLIPKEGGVGLCNVGETVTA